MLALARAAQLGSELADTFSDSRACTARGLHRVAPDVPPPRLLMLPTTEPPHEAFSLRSSLVRQTNSMPETGGASSPRSGLCWLSLRLLQEACKGVRKPIDLSRLVGTQMPPVEVDIPPGLNTGQTIQVRKGSATCIEIFRVAATVPYHQCCCLGLCLGL